MATYSKDIIAANGPDRITSWVDHICQNNNPFGLLKLLEQTHEDVHADDCAKEATSKMDNNDYNIQQHEMSRIIDQIVKNYAGQNINNGTNTQRTRIRIHVGEMDEIATVSQAKELNERLRLDNEDDVVIYKGCTHAVMNESGLKWRRDALDYLNC